jgi:Ni,Fe-hydrogenase maturation factor
MQGGGSPGEIHHFVRDEWANYRTGLSSHGLGVFEALMLARELGVLPEKLDLYGIEISSALPGDSACETVILAASKIANSIVTGWQKSDQADR